MYLVWSLALKSIDIQRFKDSLVQNIFHANRLNFRNKLSSTLKDPVTGNKKTNKLGHGVRVAHKNKKSSRFAGLKKKDPLYPPRREPDQPVNLWTIPTLAGLEVSPGGFRAEFRTVLGKAQTSRVEASQGVYCPGFI